MSTITKEHAKDLRNAFQCWQQDYDPVEDKAQYDMFGLGMVAMDALLASLEAEPVASCIVEDGSMCVDGFGEYVGHSLPDGTHQLYTVPPTPIVSQEATPENIAILASTFAPRGVTYQWDSDECNAAADSWNACVAAMLAAPQQEVKQ